MWVRDKNITLSQPTRWLILFAIVFVCLAPGRYDQAVLGWMSDRFGGTPVELGVEIKVNPRAPFDRYGIIIITNLTDQPLTVQNVRINRRKDAQCSIDPNEGSPAGSRAALQPGANIIVANAALIVSAVPRPRL